MGEGESVKNRMREETMKATKTLRETKRDKRERERERERI